MPCKPFKIGIPLGILRRTPFGLAKVCHPALAAKQHLQPKKLIEALEALK